MSDFTCSTCGNTCTCCEPGACMNCAMGIAVAENTFAEAARSLRKQLEAESLDDALDDLDDLEEAFAAALRYTIAAYVGKGEA